MKTKSTQEWQDILDNAGVPNGPINTVDKVVADPQVIAREMILEIDHPVSGKIKVPGIPIKLSDTPGDIRMTSPLLGQHTEEILKELLNYDDEKIEELKRADIF